MAIEQQGWSVGVLLFIVAVVRDWGLSGKEVIVAVRSPVFLAMLLCSELRSTLKYSADAFVCFSVFLSRLSQTAGIIVS